MTPRTPTASQLGDQVDRAPRQALDRARELVALTSPSATAERAALLAIEADSYSALELDAEARDAARRGLALAPSPTDPTHVALLIAHAQNVYDADGLARDFAAVRDARRAQNPGSAADICLLIAMGNLQHRQDRAAEAVVSLTEAYRASGAPALRRQRVAAAGMLAAVMRSAGDPQQALDLNQEVIDWDDAQGAAMDLSVNEYLRGSIFAVTRDYARAMNAFGRARELSEQLGDAQGIAFADLSTCQVRIETGDLVAARKSCERAAAAFRTSGSTDVLKQTQALQSRIDLAEGHPQPALARLDQVLDHDGSDLPARQVASIYKVRSQARAGLGDYRNAYADLDEYLRRTETEYEVDRTRNAAAWRARFETDRQIERNGALQHALGLSEEIGRRQAQQLRLTVLVIVIGALGSGLLVFMLVANLRYRKVLTRLAQQDALTRLANRWQITQVATEALLAARSSGTPVCLGLIDLDHFKAINDRCGHATGDRVLREFADLSRQQLRSGDTLGRWGGEEFLLILPDTPLDTAIQIADRLRAAALRIELPDSAAGLKVSFSAGLATGGDGRPLEEVLACADAALYEAKNRGRDGVRIDDASLRTATTGVRRALMLRA